MFNTFSNNKRIPRNSCFIPIFLKYANSFGTEEVNNINKKLIKFVVAINYLNHASVAAFVSAMNINVSVYPNILIQIFKKKTYLL